MESKRQRQVAETIRRHFSLVLQNEGSYIYGAKPMVTVTAAKASPDLSQAKIYLSVYNIEDKQSVILQMEDNYHRLRQSFAHRVKKHMRRVPELSFFLDNTLDEMYRLNELFGKLEDDDQMGKEEG